MAEKQLKPLKIFYSCADAERDRRLLVELERHFSSLKHEGGGRITTWYDDNILPGMERDREINTHFYTADIILLMLSPDFFASNYCNKQMQQALDRHRAERAWTIPILLRPVDWTHIPLSEYQSLPARGKFIDNPSRIIRDKIFKEVVEGIRTVVEMLEAHKSKKEQRELPNTDFSNAPLVKEALYARLAELHTDRADTFYQQGLYQEAQESYTVASSYNPKFAPAYYGLGETLYKLCQYQEALRAYDMSIHYKNNVYQTALAYKSQGEILWKLGNYEEAVKAYMNAARYGDNAELYKGLGDAYYVLLRHERAIEAYMRALRRDPLDMVTFERLLQLDPDLATKINIYIRKGNQLDEGRRYYEALAAYRQAMHLDPDHTTAYQLLLQLGPKAAYDHYLKEGNDLYMAGQDEEALDAYELALLCDPTRLIADHNRRNIISRV